MLVRLSFNAWISPADTVFLGSGFSAGSSSGSDRFNCCSDFFSGARPLSRLSSPLGGSGLVIVAPNLVNELPVAHSTPELAASRCTDQAGLQYKQSVTDNTRLRAVTAPETGYIQVLLRSPHVKIAMAGSSRTRHERTGAISGNNSQ